MELDEPLHNCYSFNDSSELIEAYPTFSNSSPMSSGKPLEFAARVGISPRMEDKSTPYHREHISNMARGKSSVDQIKSGLDLDGRTLVNVSIEDFVKHFMKCDKDVIEKALAGSWDLDTDAVARFETGIKSGKEADLHEPFMTTTRSLLQKVIATLGVPQSVKDAGPYTVPDATKPHIIQRDGKTIDLSGIFHDTKGTTYYRYYGTGIKPDFLGHAPVPEGEPCLFSADTKTEKRDLTLVSRPGEFKKRNRGQPVAKKPRTDTLAAAPSLPPVDENAVLGTSFVSASTLR